MMAGQAAGEERLIMHFKSFSFRWWWYGLVEDLHQECEKELRALEDVERNKGHDWTTSKENLPCGWYSISKVSLDPAKKLTVSGPYHCIWESPQHQAIRGRYAGKIFQRRLSSIPPFVGVVGGLLGIASFIMQCIRYR
jgi:hypothetical protein